MTVSLNFELLPTLEDFDVVKARRFNSKHSSEGVCHALWRSKCLTLLSKVPIFR